MERNPQDRDVEYDSPEDLQRRWEAVANGESLIWASNERPDPERVAEIVELTRQNREEEQG